MRCPPWLKAFLSSSLLAYALATAILVGVIDQRTALTQRMNAMLDWGDYPAKLDSGVAQYNERELRFAVRYYKLVAQLLPQSDQPLSTIGYCYARLGEYGRAVSYYQQALSKSKDHFWLEYNLGMLYYRLNAPERAYAAFQHIADRDIRSMAESAVLSALSRMQGEGRRSFFSLAGEFAVIIRQKSMLMMTRIDAERRQSSGALGDFKPIGAGVVMHPWTRFFQPGKELFF